MRRRFLVSSLNRMGLDCFEPEGAFYAFPSIRTTGLSSEEFCEKLLFGKKVAVVPGNAFGDSGEGLCAHQLFVFHRPFVRGAAPHRAVFAGAGRVSDGARKYIVIPCRTMRPRRWPRPWRTIFRPKARPPGRWARAAACLLKPNLVAKHAPEKAVTTHPAVLDAVCAALRRRGVESITRGGFPRRAVQPRCDARASIRPAACWRCASATARWPTRRARQRARKTDGVRVKEFSLLRPVLEADFIIDLPKVKTHVMTGMYCAVKNLFGTVPGLQKAEFHMRFPEKEPFGEMLVDLCETVRPAAYHCRRRAGYGGRRPRGRHAPGAGAGAGRRGRVCGGPCCVPPDGDAARCGCRTLPPPMPAACARRHWRKRCCAATRRRQRP